MKKMESLKRANAVFQGSLEYCNICPRRCGVNRIAGKTGYCKAPLNPRIYSYSAHHGEEPPLSGTKGSGTIFFSHCNMRCVYCQNYYFSQLGNGITVPPERLAKIMLNLQKTGCHNINLVTPTPYIPQIVAALDIAFRDGLTIPIVFNTSGYELVDTLKVLEGIIDIYLPDMRYSDKRMAKRYSDADDYVEHNRAAVIEMHRQVGDLVCDADGNATRGLIIRLLAIPNYVSGTKKTLKFIKENISEKSYLSIMSQYYPAFRAAEYSEISAKITSQEYQEILDEVRKLGLNNGWVQDGPADFDSRFFGTNIQEIKSGD